MSNPDEINKAVAAHTYWKHRLRLAIALGHSDLSVEDARSDTRCAFGRWLHNLPPQLQRSSQWLRVTELHTMFHLNAAEVLTMALAGMADDANDALALGGEFHQTSVQLITAMRAWKNAPELAAHIGSSTGIDARQYG